MHPKVKKIFKYVFRTLYVILITLGIAVLTLYCAMAVLAKGPSQELKRLFVLSVKETSAGGFLADMYLSQAEIDEILNTNHEDTNENTDTSLIKIDVTLQQVENDKGSADGENSKDIEIIDIVGGTYNGKLMIIKDPSRIIMGTPSAYGQSASGLLLRDMLKKYDAVAGINAGGFIDPNGNGTGGLPEGIVIKDGKLMWGSTSTVSTVIGFDRDHILHVGRMSAQEALNRGIAEACSFGPALIVNGKPQNSGKKLGGGINPRTAIGQRADGAVLMLVINGRSVSSLGVTYDDLVDIMLSYGAVNAGNLDGGSSTLMMYEGEPINSSAYIFGERVLATAFLVK